MQKTCRTHKLFMFNFCRCFIGFKSILWVNKTPKMNSFVVLKNASNPFVSNLAPCDAFIAACVIRPVFGIAAIFTSIANSKIANLIVGWIAVNMVYFACRPFVKMPKPNKLMTSVKSPINSNKVIAVWFSIASSPFSSKSTLDIYSSVEYTIIGKCKKFFKSCLCGFHSVVPLINFNKEATINQSINAVNALG